MNIVLDTNVLVSALWSQDRKPAAILNGVLANQFTACYDHRILEEYYRVLRRPKFLFSESEIHDLLRFIEYNGLSMIAGPLTEIPFQDEDDRKFYEVAKYCDAPLITGSQKHYPKDRLIVTVANFHRAYLS